MLRSNANAILYKNTMQYFVQKYPADESTWYSLHKKKYPSPLGGQGSALHFDSTGLIISSTFICSPLSTV